MTFSTLRAAHKFFFYVYPISWNLKMPKSENPYHAMVTGHLQNILVYHNQLVSFTTVYCTRTISFHLGPTLTLSRWNTKKEPVLTESKTHDFLSKSVRDHYFYHFRETNSYIAGIDIGS